jgi:mono/diheme cytochrome c family protein
MAYLFIGTWIIIALFVFVIALSGGPAAARERVLQTQTRRGRRGAGLIIGAVFIGMGIAVPAIVIARNQDSNHAGRARVKLTAAEEKGRELFGRACNECHTLAEAKTVGKVGPNLDILKAPKALVLDAIANGRARGAGRMPAQLLQGTDANDVADFVSRVAGTQ